jgi:hypothetical protein
VNPIVSARPSRPRHRPSPPARRGLARTQQPTPAAVARVAVLGASGYRATSSCGWRSRTRAWRSRRWSRVSTRGRPAGELAARRRCAGHAPAVAGGSRRARRAARGRARSTRSSPACRTARGRRSRRSKPELASQPLRIVDLSSDFRDGPAATSTACPRRSATRSRAPRASPTRAAIPRGDAVAAAGARGGWLAGPVTVTALSGVSGAGRAP